MVIAAFLFSFARMNASELYGLLDQNKEKLPLIDRIMKYHPAMGTELGWSWYVGGMRDTGEWKLEVLLKVPYAVLLSTLIQWDSEAKQIEKDRQEEEVKRKRYEEEGRLDEYDKEIAEENKRLWKEVKDKFEKTLLWGKQ